eukprot:CAMPEP_0119326450 /NCGR_PEP_ID=MMETSP1333-20130426/68439_1 /TAXON_ID=418940 /ORGANISM="Scyphosphaera apsteinii, Strain RCC1455" /LENGTH=430 /DNA_ID=CAMNT_0007334763 /DNA_START=130 /DNA_END=1419 /DNA_ORIENTATION=+
MGSQPSTLKDGDHRRELERHLQRKASITKDLTALLTRNHELQLSNQQLELQLRLHQTRVKMKSELKDASARNAELERENAELQELSSRRAEDRKRSACRWDINCRRGKCDPLVCGVPCCAYMASKQVAPDMARFIRNAHRSRLAAMLPQTAYAVSEQQIQGLLRRLGKCSRRSGDWTLCLGGARAQPPCLVVSIGIGGEWDFEVDAAQRGCQVHAFDPTIALRGVHEHFAKNNKGITFHYVGLGTSTSYRGGYNVGGPADLSEVAHLPDLLHRIGAAGRRIDVLKMDCEGCEWAEFRYLRRHAPHTLCFVDQLLIELHLSTTLHLKDTSELIGMAQHVFIDHGFVLYQHHMNWGFEIDRGYFAASVKQKLSLNNKSPCCDEIHVIRPASAAECAPSCRKGNLSRATLWENDTMPRIATSGKMVHNISLPT